MMARILTELEPSPVDVLNCVDVLIRCRYAAAGNALKTQRVWG